MVRRLLVDGRSGQEAAEALCASALRLGSGDNISAVVLRFSSRPLPLALAAKGASVLLRPTRATSMRKASSEAAIEPMAAALGLGG